MIRVNLFLEQPNGQRKQVGVRLLKTEKSETLIENLGLSNCISALRQSLGLSTMIELDCELAKRFRRTVPVEDLNKLLTEEDSVERRPVIEDLLTGDLSDRLSETPQPVSRRNSLASSITNISISESSSNSAKSNQKNSKENSSRAERSSSRPVTPTINLISESGSHSIKLKAQSPPIAVPYVRSRLN